MKRYILSAVLLVSSSAFAISPISKQVNDAVQKGIGILAEKSVPQQQTEMCSLMKEVVASSVIAPQLLGNYAQLATDKAGIAEFTKLIPSMLATKLIGYKDKASGMTVDVDQDATDRGNGLYGVGVTLHASNGNPYNATLVIGKFKSGYQLVDGEYMGFSAVSYMANDFQQKLDGKYQTDPRTPVSDLNKDILADKNFVNCN